VTRLAPPLLGFAAAIAAAALLGGCGIQKAARVEVQVLDNQIVLLKPADGLQRGGETVLKIDNYAQHPVNMVLAETDATAATLPHKLIDAVTPRDDSRIVAMTSRVDKAKVTFAYGAIPSPAPRIATLHVYLKPGKRYLLFDKLGGYARGIALVLVPPSSK
jgi:hypothetical protein